MAYMRVAARSGREGVVEGGVGRLEVANRSWRAEEREDWRVGRWGSVAWSQARVARVVRAAAAAAGSVNQKIATVAAGKVLSEGRLIGSGSGIELVAFEGFGGSGGASGYMTLPLRKRMS